MGKKRNAQIIGACGLAVAVSSLISPWNLFWLLPVALAVISALLLVRATLVKEENDRAP